MKLKTAVPIVAIVALTIFATAFALINYRSAVRVWPLPGAQPLTIVIAVAFVLGAAISGLAVHLLHQKRAPIVGPTGANIDPR